ncbi:hypothetical protein DFH09DRAFT_1082289 [Mycena vulgaris]|nr:hypothetical protein DFH09DRAFT_1082289 [Mycena vulgaris]
MSRQPPLAFLFRSIATFGSARGPSVISTPSPPGWLISAPGSVIGKVLRLAFRRRRQVELLRTVSPGKESQTDRIVNSAIYAFAQLISLDLTHRNGAVTSPISRCLLRPLFPDSEAGVVRIQRQTWEAGTTFSNHLKCSTRSLRVQASPHRASQQSPNSKTGDLPDWETYILWSPAIRDPAFDRRSRDSATSEIEKSWNLAQIVSDAPKSGDPCPSQPLHSETSTKKRKRMVDNGTRQVSRNTNTEDEMN